MTVHASKLLMVPLSIGEGASVAATQVDTDLSGNAKEAFSFVQTAMEASDDEYGEPPLSDGEMIKALDECEIGTTEYHYPSPTVEDAEDDEASSCLGGSMCLGKEVEWSRGTSTLVSYDRSLI